MSQPLTPTPALALRVDSLDLLRGIAILGIFLMNTQSMLLPQSAYTNPSHYGDFIGKNFGAYVFTHLFADEKFITIFSFMFGAGIILQGERVKSRGMSASAIHYIRMLVLLLFGLAHAYGLWYGDILVTYACCGLLLFPLKYLPPALLMAIGLIVVLAEIPINFAAQQVRDDESYRISDAWYLKPVQKVEILRSHINAAKAFSTEDIAYTGPLTDELRYRAYMSLEAQTCGFATWTFWRCGGALLIGMALQRWRFFHGAWLREAYLAIALIGIALGMTITALGIVHNIDTGWDDYVVWGFGSHFNYVGSLIHALGYMAVGVLVALRVATPASIFLKTAVIPIRAVGKTALSNYIFQSLVGTTLAYAHIVGSHQFGFRWYGTLERYQLFYIVACTWAVQLILSTLWTRYFRQGPLEWLWHTLVYLGRANPPRPSINTPASASTL